MPKSASATSFPKSGNLEFTIAKPDLLKELSLVQGVVDKKETIPILSKLLISSDGTGRVTILGTDLEVSLRTQAPATVKTEGSMVVNARKLHDIVRNLPDEPIRFTQGENGWIVVDCARLKYKIVGEGPEHFPSDPGWIEPQYRIPSSVLKTFITRTIMATSEKDSRYTLNGAMFDIGNGSARMVATDGHRLALIERTGLDTGAPSTGPDVRALIPRKALSELLRLTAETDDLVCFGIDENRLYFGFGNRLLVATKLTGTFVAYEKVLPNELPHSVRVDGAEFGRAIRRIALMADARSRCVRLTFGMERLDVTAKSSETGEGQETISTDYDGPDVEIGFDSKYLLDFLAVAGDGQIAFEFKDGKSQVQMRPATGDDCNYRYVVMPMRL